MGSWWYGHFQWFYYFLHFDLSEIINNSFCQMPARYTSTASNIKNLPITPGLLYFIVKTRGKTFIYYLYRLTLWSLPRLCMTAWCSLLTGIISSASSPSSSEWSSCLDSALAVSPSDSEQNWRISEMKWMKTENILMLFLMPAARKSQDLVPFILWNFRVSFHIYSMSMKSFTNYLVMGINLKLIF